MASKVDLIEAKIIEHLNAMTSPTLYAVQGPPDEGNYTLPWAWTRVESDGDMILNQYGIHTRPVRVYIVVEGVKSDVSQVLENLHDYWEPNNANYLELNALGVVNCEPVDWEEPFAYTGETAIGEFILRLTIDYAVS